MASSSAFRKAGILMTGGGVYATAVYLAYQYQKTEPPSLPSCACHSYVDNPQRNEQYNRIANTYDDRIGLDEFFMGMNFLRRTLLRYHAWGTVLEVGAGTGRNLAYYPSSVNRIVLTDASEAMLSQAKAKIEKSESTGTSSRDRQIAVLQGDAANLNLPDKAFDTVVDTFGLCSYNDPVAALQEMARVCKPTGKILLLEHGRSKTWPFISARLDAQAERHAAQWGCVWNRDLDQVIEQSGLQVQVLSKYHFGTTYYVVCKPTEKTA